MLEKILIDTGQGETLAAICKRPEESRPSRENLLVVMLHDFPGHKAGKNDLYGDLEFVLEDKGFHTLRFDFRGCGESGGRQENFTLGMACEDLKNVLHWAGEEGYEHFMFIGEGLGGTVAVMNTDVNIHALVLMWPALDLKELGTEHFNAAGIDPKDRKRGYIEQDGHKIGTDFIRELTETDLIYALKEVYIPTLIMHGANDEVTPVDQLELARNYIRSKRIEITTFQDGGHGLDKLIHRKMMFYHVLQFLEKYG